MQLYRTIRRAMAEARDRRQRLLASELPAGIAKDAGWRMPAPSTGGETKLQESGRN